MAINSRAKGAQFELDVAEVLTKWWGTKLRRTPQSGGWNKAAVTGDIVAPDEHFPLSIECKNTEDWEFHELLKSPEKGVLPDFWKQCTSDAQGRSRKDPMGMDAPLIPLLVFKRKFHPMYAAIRADDFSTFADGELTSCFIWMYQGQTVVICLLAELLEVMPAKVFKPQ